MTSDPRSAIYALLDDCESTAERRSTRLYTGFAHERSATDGAALDAVFDQVLAGRAVGADRARR